MPCLVPAEPLAFSLAIVTCHFSLAFLRNAAKMTTGANHAFGRNPEARPTRSYQLRVGHVSNLVEMGGVEPPRVLGPVSD